MRRGAALLGAAGLLLALAQFVLAAPPANVDFTFPSVVNIGDQASFDASTATNPDDPNDAGITYGWDFGDSGTGSGQSTSHQYSSAGDKTVTLTVTDSDNETTTQTHTVHVNAPPSANFNFSPPSPQTGQSISFTSTSSDSDPGDSITGYQWDFGDGGTSSAASPSHSYSTSGTKQVKLTVTDSHGASDSKTIPVTVANQPPNASFTVTPSTLNKGQSASFDASGSSDPDGAIPSNGYSWDFGDGQTGSGKTVNHTFNANSSVDRTVKLTVTDGDGASDTATKTVHVAAITPDFSVSPAVPTAGQPGSIFSAAATTDPGGTIPDSGYSWDFGDGTTDTGKTRGHTFAAGSAGNKTVKLTATDTSGASESKTKTVRVNAPPVAKAVFAAISPEAGQNPLVPLIGQQVGFSGATTTDSNGVDPAVTDPPGATYAWDLNNDGTFGGQGETGKAVTTTFSTAGDKTVKLKVTDADGGINVTTVTVRVNTRPVSDFIDSPQTPITNQAITFASTASDPDPSTLTNPANGTLTKFEWDFEYDGHTFTADATGSNAQHTYTAAGTYNVALRVTDGGGATHVTTHPVTVENTRPDSAFSFSPAAPLPGHSVAFRSSSTPTAGKQILKYEWDFDYDQKTFKPDATTTTPTVSHTYPTAGARTAGLRVTETGGGFDISTRTIVVNAPPRASFSFSPTSPFDHDGVTFSSTSSDPDSPIASQLWDLNNDGRFGDASGAVASRSFPAAGSYVVGLRVTDSKGAVTTTTRQIVVRKRPIPPKPVIDTKVTIGGSTGSRGSRIKLLTVKAPFGSKITVRCRGRGCKTHSQTKRAGHRSIRFRKFERSLRAGAKLSISVTKPGYIGRYVSFSIHRLHDPTRSDLCLTPGKSRPGHCPGS